MYSESVIYNFTMLSSKQILASALVLVASMTSLTGCGQTGSLYMPAPKAPANTTPGAALTVPVPEAVTLLT
jgi:predicted small lipoprotein YifL